MKKLIFILFISCSLAVNAETYWVTPRGNDSHTGLDSASTGAWLTWQKAFSTAQAGDTVYFRGGVYPISRTNGQGIGMDPRYPQLGGGYDGTRENPVCYFAYQPDYESGNYPILECDAAVPTSINNRGIFIQTLDHTIFKGLTIRNVRQNYSNTIAHGIEIYWSNNVHFVNCTVHNIGGVGIGISDNDTIYLTNCDAYNNCDSLSTFQGNGADGQSVGDANNNDPTAAVFFHGCRSWNVSDDGFGQFFDGYIEWDSCWAFNNGAFDGDGNSFKHSRSDLDPVLPLARKLTHCISANNKGVWGGFVDNSNGYRSLNSHMYNCVSFNDNYGITLLGYSMGTWSGGNIYRNNIVYSANVANYYDAYGSYHWVHDHNSFDASPSITLTDDDFVSVDWTELKRPRKKDGSLPDIDFMKPAAGSDLINAGVDVGLPYIFAPDIGWAEYEEDSPVTDPLVSTTIPYSITSRGAYTGGTVTSNGGGIISARGICWGSDLNPDLTDNVTTVSGTLGLYTIAMNNLQPNTTYHVRAYVTNDFSTQYGDDVEFTTGEWTLINSGNVIVTSGGNVVKIE